MNVNTEQLFVVEIGHKELGAKRFFKQVAENRRFDVVTREDHPRLMTRVYANECLDRMTERKCRARILRADTNEPVTDWNDKPAEAPLTLDTNWEKGVYRDRYNGRLLEFPWTRNRSLGLFYCYLNPELSVSAPSLPGLFERLTTTQGWEPFLKALEVEDLTTALQPTPAVPTSENVPTITVSAGQPLVILGNRPGSARPV